MSPAAEREDCDFGGVDVGGADIMLMGAAASARSRLRYNKTKRGDDFYIEAELRPNNSVNQKNKRF